MDFMKIYENFIHFSLQQEQVFFYQEFFMLMIDLFYGFLMYTMYKNTSSAVLAEDAHLILTILPTELL